MISIKVITVGLLAVILAIDAQTSTRNRLTGLFGQPVGRKTDMLSAGFEDPYYGPVLLQDFHFIEEIAHFARERIPERVVHAKGSGAFGYFNVTSTEITKYTKAKLFNTVGKITPVGVRFSTVGGEQGSADNVFGDPRGFATKFYTEDGNYDLVGNNVPMFFIRDAMQFPSLIHANKRHPQSGLPQPNAAWDFFTLRPESLNLVTYVFSDFGIPDGYRHMPGFSIHAFKLVNANGNQFFAKFHWITNQGIKNLNASQAQSVRGSNPNYDRQDLFNAIANGNFPSWTLKAQVITPAQAEYFDFNPFDATKIWPTDDFPLFEVGVMTLNRNPNNFFSDIEQLALCPANLVPGIEPSPDRLLQGRLFSYPDAQRYRLGANHQLIPVNAPLSFAQAITQRDGAMRTDGNLGNTTNYFPNSYSSVKDDDQYLESNTTLNDAVVFRYDDSAVDNYQQPRDLYNSFSTDWKNRLHQNLATAISGANSDIRSRAIAQFKLIAPALATGVSTELAKILK